MSVSSSKIRFPIGLVFGSLFTGSFGDVDDSFSFVKIGS